MSPLPPMTTILILLFIYFLSSVFFWLLVSQVSEGAHFRKTAVTSKKFSGAQRHMPPARIPPSHRQVRPIRFPLVGESLPVSRPPCGCGSTFPDASSRKSARTPD